MTSERALVLAKPDAVQRGLVGNIMQRLEKRGYRLVACKLTRLSRPTAEEHYGEHRAKPFFQELVDFSTSGPVLAMVWEGESAVAGIRSLMGATNPANSAPGTIRGDLATGMPANLVHGSDSPERAALEIALFFKPGEVLAAEGGDGTP